MNPGMHKSPGIYYTGEENPVGKPQLGDSANALQPLTASKGVLSIQMRTIGSLTTTRRKKRWKESRRIPDVYETVC